jgi:hypothetical protein
MEIKKIQAIQKVVAWNFSIKEKSEKIEYETRWIIDFKSISEGK